MSSSRRNSFATGYGWATQPDTANEIEFGPIVEFAAGEFLLTTNTLFSCQMGEFAETDGLGFEYGWRRIRLRQASRLGRRDVRRDRGSVKSRFVQRSESQNRPNAVLEARRRR